DLTDNVNQMASNLTTQVRNIAEVTTAVAQGDLSRKITIEAKGEVLVLKETINTMVDQLNSFADEVTRVAREVGTEGTLGGQASVKGVSGSWRDLTDNVNQMASNLTTQVRNIAEVTTAVAQGDLSRKITIEAKGEVLALKETINSMVDQLNSFADEVTRVAREVGTEGTLGGQASVKGVAGTWRDLTDNVNQMASNLTDQVRGVANIVTAVANGDLKNKLTVKASGEIADLAETINDMVDTLALFAGEVTGVANEVGVEGRLGVQAEVPGAKGTWRDLTDNVNELAENLTTQVRAIGDVATAVAKGDLSQEINVKARGEVELLKNNINTMTANLRETTRINEDQDWLKSNLARFARMLQGQRDLESAAKAILSEIADALPVRHGVFYSMSNSGEEQQLELLTAYAYRKRKNLSSQFKLGEGLVGQCALEKRRILLTQAPSDYVQIVSGLGEASPLNIIVLPVLFEGEVLAVVELASLESFTTNHLDFLEQLADSLGLAMNVIQAGLRTDQLLQESQALSEELQSQQGQLEQSNAELEEQARLLEERNKDVEAKNQEVEKAQGALQTKAEQLALTSKYKSEFLANMSHELRTPLNSLLILSKMLSDNRDENLTKKQVDFAHTIHASGTELLSLINDILDISKIEAGVLSIETSEIKLESLSGGLERSFLEMARSKGIDFDIVVDKALPVSIHTDAKRLTQIIKNLMSNALKFTDEGGIKLEVERAKSGWELDNETLNNADSVIVFKVVDTGIGIPEDKQKIIFEAFQQADGSISRRHGGTGLGLAISREIARLLRGEIRLVFSEHGKGSTFAFYLPQYEDELVGNTIAGSGEAIAAADGQPGMEFTEEDVDLTLQAPDEVLDDRNAINDDDPVLLIIEDDPRFAAILLDMAHERGFKGLVASQGETGVALARKFQPDAITLDIHLPSLSGWTVLDLIKHDEKVSHIPVHVISVEEQPKRALEQGALTVIEKPVNSEQLQALFDSMDEFRNCPRSMLVVEDNDIERESIVELIGGEDIEIDAVATGAEALTALKARSYDCMVLDLKLPDMTGFTLLKKMQEKKVSPTPVIVYTGKELTRREETQLKKTADSIIIKGARSPERLLDETALFLHRIQSQLSETKREMMHRAHMHDPVLMEKKALVVDDDVRNLFAVTTLLEQQQRKVVYAENGKEGIEVLRDNPDVDVVLMDIMMPEMDGYEAMGCIRKIKKYTELPIIALTAKAMKGDREKCIDAGASDYISKPVNGDQLLSLLRVWLYG
ncbi:MAG: response regulator, partial [Gammaproteobacteria bacterium]|nr:response regulator [Gammaproteobacteria bacterium]